MIDILVPKSEYFNEQTNEFIEIKGASLKLEHSLISIRNWESKWNVAFLGKREKTNEQMLDYLRCMTVHPGNVSMEVYQAIPDSEMQRIAEYIKSPMSATILYDYGDGNGGKDVVTADLIYYWMISLNIPMEFQKVHLNQLLTLIRITSMKNNPKKMSPSEILRRNKRLNEERKKKYNTKG